MVLVSLIANSLLAATPLSSASGVRYSPGSLQHIEPLISREAIPLDADTVLSLLRY